MQIEFRNDSMRIQGYVNAIERESDFIPLPNGKRFKEVIKQGAFDKALKRAANVYVLFNHQEDNPLGSLKDGNLTLTTDAIGLKANVEIRDADFIEKARKPGFLKGWSFGFQDIKSKWEKTKDGFEKRLIEDLHLFEVSIIGGYSRPAYPATSIEIRNDSSILERRYNDFEIKANPQVDLYEHQIRFLTLKGMKI